MSLILSIETSVKVCSAAIHESGKLRASAEVHIEQAHASKLALIIDEVLETSNLAPAQLNAVAVTSGPGSYTGLRIGTSTAKGLCVALGIPLLSVGTLDLMAHQVKQRCRDTLLCPMIDARRMEVYCCLYNQSMEVVLPTEAKVIDEQSFQEYLEKHEIVFFGDGADKCKEVINSENARFIEGVYPSAASMGELVFHKFQSKMFEDLIDFEPHYLKEFLVKKPTQK
jgi:tRNA threonylcarbamoyladenosine biosynthesis protein TsaB